MDFHNESENFAKFRTKNWLKTVQIVQFEFPKVLIGPLESNHRNFNGESTHIFCPPLTDDVEGSSVIYRRFMTGNDCGGDGKTSMSRDEPCCVQEEREDDDEMLQMRYPSPIVASIRCIDHNVVSTAQIGTEIDLASASTDNNAAVTEREFRSSELIRDETRPKCRNRCLWRPSQLSQK